MSIVHIPHPTAVTYSEVEEGLKERGRVEESPNRLNPEADIAFIIEELFVAFDNAEGEYAVVRSAVGSRFHARVLNAAKHLGLS